MTSRRSDREPRGQRFGARFRMHGSAAFARVYETRIRRNAGPLLVYARPHGIAHGAEDTRLGLSVSRRCGNAVKRHRIKRRVREAFRAIRADLPAGYDLLVVVRPHEPLGVEDYRRLLDGAARELDRRWRSETRPDRPDSPAPPHRDGRSASPPES